MVNDAGALPPLGQQSAVEPKQTTPPRAPEPEASGASAQHVVGIGASAGGLAALEAFFAGIPPSAELGLAYVVVQHLAPDHESILADLLRRKAPIPVFEVNDGMRVQADCAYVIPPGYDMAFENGVLRLTEPSEPHGHRLPIDFLFRSLAAELHAGAMGVVLSGMGCDGTEGIRAIKAEGGLVMAQTPQTAEFDPMPSSALATGLVDFELPPGELAGKLVEHVRLAGELDADVGSLPALPTAHLLERLFALLRAQTRHDFSQYKPSTINRRIERRMVAHELTSLADYLAYLGQTPTEVEALFRDLLIGVTSFFRDAEAFARLENDAVPRLFADRAPGTLIRLWLIACSTGEEAFSIAILLFERMEALRQRYVVQIFATDIDSRAIATARAGHYPASIANDVSPARLARHFTADPEGGGYRIHREIRDMLVFSEHDVLQDPPFSKLDLISCRNLLIYLGAEPQRRLVPLFHFALNPNGQLFLGTSEGVGDFGDLFETVDAKAKLFVRKSDAQAIKRAAYSRLLPRMPTSASAAPRTRASVPEPAKVPLRTLVEQALLAECAPTAVLVDATGDILYVHGRTGQFLEPPPGEPGVSNLVKMTREGLRPTVSHALREAASLGSARLTGRVLTADGSAVSVDVKVSTLTTVPTPPPVFLVILTETSTAMAPAPPADAPAADASFDVRIAALERELQAKDEYLQSTHEALERSNEEQKSSNEEMQSVNEELQSTNEELETSKEELQAVNEELSTVNHELQAKVADLSWLNDDMRNLLAGTGIATIFLDLQLCILRFTPSACQLINLIPTDVGRPVAHLASNLVGYDTLVADTYAVLEDLTPKEAQVQTAAGAWFMLRIRPYRTVANVIQGVVITFTDITALRAAQRGLQDANRLLRLAIIARDAEDALVVKDLDGRTLAWNPGATHLYGWTEAEALGMNERVRIPEALREGAAAKARELSRLETLAPYRTERLTKTGNRVPIWMTATALVNDDGQIYAIATTERRDRTSDS